MHSAWAAALDRSLASGSLPPTGALRLALGRPALRPLGLFPLGMGNLGALVVSVATFLVILSQFQQGDGPAPTAS